MNCFILPVTFWPHCQVQLQVVFVDPYLVLVAEFGLHNRQLQDKTYKYQPSDMTDEQIYQEKMIVMK